MVKDMVFRKQSVRPKKPPFARIQHPYYKYSTNLWAIQQEMQKNFCENFRIHVEFGKDCCNYAQSVV